MENAHGRRYFVVETPAADGMPDAMQSFVVCSQVSERGWYLQDLVRHPDAPRGAGELVATFALETLRRDGFDFATMGLVPFFDPEGNHDRVAVPRAAMWCIRHFDRAFRFSGLQQFRAKFPATHVVPAHVLFWPRILTPLIAWDVVRLLAPGLE